uniref:uncharacterized protein LOC120340517 n=1 Tax=Styela clava TaxID=7725 RepID=UPI00193A7CA5|nr:uncharacterized protein LOC120340517 [Styela clava]
MATTITPPPVLTFIKQETDDEEQQSMTEPPVPVVKNIKLEETTTEEKVPVHFKLQDDSTDSEMLKQRLDMYWKGMIKYQQMLQKEQSNKLNNESQILDYQNASKKTDGGEVLSETNILEKAKNVVQKLIEDDHTTKTTTTKEQPQMPWPSLTTIAANKQLRSPKNGQTNHISSLPPSTMNNVTLQQASLLSQQAIATMLSLQNMQQQHSSNFGFGSILPPPPTLGHSSGIAAIASTTSNPFQPHTSTVGNKPSSTTSTSIASGTPRNLSHSPTSHNNNNKDDTRKNPHEMPLDLSMPLTGKKRSHDSIPKLLAKSVSQQDSKYDRPLSHGNTNKDKKNKNPVSLASIQSNFPNLLNNQSQSRSAQKAALEAHIQNGLANDVIPAVNGPFTSLYQKHDNPGHMIQAALAVAGNKTLNELTQGNVPPLPIQQWILAAVSAQKMQQMALNQISLFRQCQQATSQPDPPKKRQKMDNGVSPYQHFGSSHAGIMQTQTGNTYSQPPQNPSRHSPANPHFTPNRPNNFSSSNNRSPKTSASPTLSPDSTQSQSGKRYRRYAKPPYSYVSLITLSILSSREKKLRLSQILRRISEMFPFFNGSYQGWRDSVRHNLSQNECFVKVLKNPYRPTAKGNFWTVNLSSIPHELLLRQNTLVSRYAQDSGYRYRKDLSEVFDLRTGALKVSVPRHLLRESGDSNMSALSEDPAAVMEAILLEETSEDESNDYKDKISPEVRQFTLEDLFNQQEDGEEDSLLSSGRTRGRSKPVLHHASPPQPPTILPQSFSPSLFQPGNPFMTQTRDSPSMVHDMQASLQNRALDAHAHSFANLRMLPQSLLPGATPQIPLALSNESQNPFAAAQTALLSKALAATQFQGLPMFQKMFYANQMPQNGGVTPLSSYNPPLSKTPSPPATSISHISPIPRRATPSPARNNNQDQESRQNTFPDPPSSLKKNKRKGGQPVRCTNDDNSPMVSAVDSSVSPQISFTLPASTSLATPSRTFSSEADSIATSTNQFSSSIMSSSSSKSQTSTSPRHDDSSEFEENRQNMYSINRHETQAATGISGFQALRMFGTQSL